MYIKISKKELKELAAMCVNVFNLNGNMKYAKEKKARETYTINNYYCANHLGVRARVKIVYVDKLPVMLVDLDYDGVLNNYMN